MIKKVVNNIKYIKSMLRINMALSRGSLNASLRNLKETDPETWEFSAFSQNGEDGIIDFLLSKLKKLDYYFIEIGASNGIENNSAFLAIAKKYSGIMIEGDEKQSLFAKSLIGGINLGVENINMFIKKGDAEKLKEISLILTPDIFSLDIDGNDYYIAEEILKTGFRPKIFIVEYNSAFGPEKSISVKYKDDFDIFKEHESQLYYGASISAWKKLFNEFTYQFITVERNGVNAFFVNTDYFDKSFVNNIKGFDFRENYYQMRKFKETWDKQFQKISGLNFIDI